MFFITCCSWYVSFCVHVCSFCDSSSLHSWCWCGRIQWDVQLCLIHCPCHIGIPHCSSESTKYFHLQLQFYVMNAMKKRLFAWRMLQTCLAAWPMSCIYSQSLWKWNWSFLCCAWFSTSTVLSFLSSVCFRFVWVASSLLGFVCFACDCMCDPAQFGWWFSHVDKSYNCDEVTDVDSGFQQSVEFIESVFREQVSCAKAMVLIVRRKNANSLACLSLLTSLLKKGWSLGKLWVVCW